MPLRKLPFKPGVNRENTRYTNEGGWYECDKIRFRQSMPEKIGGWSRISSDTFLGVCRSIHPWIALNGQAHRGIGTNLKFYIEKGSAYYDVTPIRETTSAGDVTFSATNGSSEITVTDTTHGALLNDFVTFSGAVSLGGNVTAAVLNAEHQITEITDVNTYKVVVSVTANASDTGNGGASVVGTYQLNTGPEITTPASGWGAGLWGEGVWGTGTEDANLMRVWTQDNFGEDLIFGYRESDIYYWDKTNGVSTRGVLLSSLGGASDVPTTHLHILVADISRFVFALGCNALGSADINKTLIRWSDQEDAANWTPAATNQAGSVQLSRGSEIVAATPARQEVLVWTDTTLYSLQYVGAPIVWGTQVVGENVSVMSSRSVAYTSGVAYWMGKGVFYMYNGRTLPLRCDLLRYVFSDFNYDQYEQVFAGTNEQFNEIWWFYCSASSTTVDRYVIYNYVDNLWYYGTMARTAWRDNAWDGQPAATTYNNRIVVHETGVDDNETDTPAAIEAYITSAQFDINDGDRYAFVRRVIPDVSFEGSTAITPTATMTLTPLNNSGSGYNSPASEGGNSSGVITRSASLPIEAYTEQLNIRIRGRQMILKIESDEVGVQWQLGAPRLDLRPDGRRA